MAGPGWKGGSLRGHLTPGAILRWLGIFMIVSFCIELAVGAHLLATALLYVGTFIGFASALLCGIDTVIGALMLCFTLRTTGIFLVAKTFLAEEWSRNNSGALTIGLVYFLGYATFFILSFVTVKFLKPTRSKELNFDSATCTSLSWTVFFVCAICSLIPDSLNGGVWGALKVYSSLGVFSIPLAIGASLAQKPWRTLWHPQALVLVVLYLGFAVVNTGKEAFVTPVLGYVVSLLAYRKIKLWAFLVALCVGLVGLSTVVGPYSDSIRNTGARDMVGMERLKATANAWMAMFNPEERKQALNDLEMYREDQRNKSIFEADIGYLGRLMSINEGYVLVNATEQQGPIGASLLLEEMSVLLPRVIAPWKSEFGTPYILTRYTGLISYSSIDYIGVAYGCFPTFYTMGGVVWLPLIATILTLPVFIFLRFIELRYPARAIYVGLFLLLWHTIAESTSLIGSLYPLFFLWISLQGFHMLTSRGTIKASGSLVR